MNAMFRVQAATIDQIIGTTVAPPVPGFNNMFSSISNVFIVGIQLFLTVAAISVLIYLLWGAYDWISSSGDAEKLAMAQAKMTHAVIGLLLTIVALIIFAVVAGPILGIITQNDAGQWVFKLPSINP